MVRRFRRKATLSFVVFLNEPTASTLRHAYKNNHAAIRRSDCARMANMKSYLSPKVDHILEVVKVSNLAATQVAHVFRTYLRSIVHAVFLRDKRP